MSNLNGKWTRRRFLEVVGMAGGSAAVYETMTALGLLGTPDAWAGPAPIPKGSGSGKSVLILGAGIGGLTAAYELTRAGYRCEILEAQNRAGGRSLTARRGTVITEESPEHGVTRQECGFDEGLHLDMGPGRISRSNRRVLHYCKELGVALEVYVMETSANLFQTDKAFGGKPRKYGQIANDTRGYIAELLSKATRKGALDEELDEGDRDKLKSLLEVFGDLGQGTAKEPFAFGGTTRDGCKDPLTVYNPCEPPVKLGLQELLSSEFWEDRFYNPDEYHWQPTMFHPVGGMDMIVEGFKRKVGNLISYESEVREIRLEDEGVEISYVDARTGEKHRKRADYCISNIPLPVLQKIPANFSPEFNTAVQQAKFASSCKVGWQANERFWESDENQIYGGISWIDDIITQMWYPSNGYFGKKGILTGAYISDHPPQYYASRFGKMSLTDRLVTARRGAVKLHPECGDDSIVPFKLGLSIAWHNVPYQLGAWPNWNGEDEADRRAYARLLAPDGRFHVVGDQTSTLPGWQEGAMMSAEHTVEQIAGLRPLTVPEISRAPHTRRLMEGRF